MRARGRPLQIAIPPAPGRPPPPAPVRLDPGPAPSRAYPRSRCRELTSRARSHDDPEPLRPRTQTERQRHRDRGQSADAGSPVRGRRRSREQRRALPDQPGVYLFLGREGQGPLRGQGQVGPQTGRFPLLEDPAPEQPGARRDGREHRADRVPSRLERVRGPVGGAELHQAVQAPLQHPPARRQVVPLHRFRFDEDFPRSTSPASDTAWDDSISAPTRTLSGSAGPWTCSRRSSCFARARGPSRADAAGILAWTTTSNAARLRASATSPGRTIGRGSTA